MSSNSEELMVSVDMITYKHEQFLAQAIEGVLMQETNFRYELIIADDCSPDNTASIVNHYIKNHPKGKIIRYYRHEKNKGMQANADFALQKCTGKYIALCEGDDYWTDPLKLQKQVDFLEANSDFSMCFHGVLDLKELKFDEAYNKSFHGRDEINFEDFLTGNGFFPRTCSTVIRNSDFIKSKFINYSHKLFTDLSLKLIPSFYGKTKYLNESMAVYRVNEGSVMGRYKIRDYLFDQICEIENLINFFKPDNRIVFLIKLRNTYQFQLAGYELLLRNYISGFKLFFTAIRYLKFGVRAPRVILIFPGCLFWLFVPKFLEKKIANILGIKNSLFFENK
jgi:glycosyltransferase involved in cell wall biosynthesis